MRFPFISAIWAESWRFILWLGTRLVAVGPTLDRKLISRSKGENEGLISTKIVIKPPVHERWGSLQVKDDWEVICCQRTADLLMDQIPKRIWSSSHGVALGVAKEKTLVNHQTCANNLWLKDSYLVILFVLSRIMKWRYTYKFSSTSWYMYISYIFSINLCIC